MAALSAWSAGQKPEDVAKACTEKLKGAQSLSAAMLVTFPAGQPQKWYVKFLKPNLYAVVAPDQQFRSDGKVETVYLPLTKQFQTTDRKDADISDAPFTLGLNPFFAGNTPFPVAGGERTLLDGKSVVGVSVQEPGFAGITTLYIDPQSDLPVGYDEPIEPGKVLTVRYSDVKLNADLKPEAFAWSPPADAKPMQAPNLGSKLLEPEQTAPSPPAKDISGNDLDLSRQFASHKATLLYFWNGPAPVPEAASLKDLYTQLHDQRFQIILIDFNSGTDGSKELQDQKFPFPVVLDDKGTLAKAYGVQSQTEYIVGSDGKVGPHFLGYDPDGIVKALRQRGFRV